MCCTAQVWDTRKFKAPLHVWEGLPALFETTKVPLGLLSLLLRCLWTARACSGVQDAWVRSLSSGQPSSLRVPTLCRRHAG